MLAEPAGADRGRDSGRADAHDRRDANSGDDRRQRQRKLHHEQQLARRHPHRHAGLCHRVVQASQSGDRRANDRQKRVERQRDERRARSDAANERERQEESEEGQARDRLRDVRQKQERAADRGPARGENPRRKTERGRDDGGDDPRARDAAGRAATARPRGLARIESRRSPVPAGRAGGRGAGPDHTVSRNFRTRGSADAATASGVSQIASSPASSTPMRVARAKASPRSWVTITTVVPSSRRMRVNSRRLDSRDRIERAERLVHQQDGRIDREGAGDADPLPLAARKLVRPARRVVLRRESHQVEERAHALACAASLPPLEPRDEPDVLLDRHVGKQADILEDVSDSAPERNARPLTRVAAFDRDTARLRKQQAIDELQNRALSRAAPADEGKHLTARHRERDFPQHRRPAGVGEAHAIKEQDWVGRQFSQGSGLVLQHFLTARDKMLQYKT